MENSVVSFMLAGAEVRIPEERIRQLYLQQIAPASQQTIEIKVDIRDAVEALKQLRATTLAPPALGHLWEDQGGIYAGLVRGTNDQPDHHLIIAPPGSAGHLNGIKIGTYGDDITGASHRTDGLANTQAFAAAGSELCQQILQLDIDGHRDWYLGADGELHLAYCNTPELFSKEGWYITSTQRGAHTVRNQDFEHGCSSRGLKDYEGRAVAFRRIQLSTSVPR